MQFRLLMAVLLFVASSKSQAQPVTENQLKAVFIYNFTNFIQWPEDAFRQPADAFVIGVLGSHPMSPYLEEAVKGETVNGRSIRIRYYDSPDAVGQCHILVVTPAFKDSFREIIALVEHNPVLTVSDGDGFTEKSGMVRLFKEGNKIRLEINSKRVERARLAVSAKLLKLANIYNQD